MLKQLNPLKKIHPNLLSAVETTLKEIFFGNIYADKAIQRVLKSNSRWGSRDRKFIAETTYEIVRFWRLYQEVNETYPTYTEASVPEIIEIYLIHRGISDADGAVFDSVHRKISEQSKQRAVRESVPDWLDAYGGEQLGETWEAELNALNSTAPVILRANTIKTTREKLALELQSENISVRPVEGIADALELPDRRNVFTSKAFQSGLFEIQDTASQMVAPFLECSPGMRVIDACAGGGGKSLHIAALMKNRGRILALDTFPKKLEELQRRARRNSISIIETRAIDSTKVIKRLHESADRLLLDVPCSGSGILRRNPDAKWKLSREVIDNIIVLQRSILDSYCAMLKPGGIMVYATCSIFPDENIKNVEKFISVHPEFSISDQKILTPAKDSTDGFFMAKFVKKK